MSFTPASFKRIGATMLKDDAIERYESFKNSPDNTWNDALLVYNAGWDSHGEWTCCQCGTMIGKNLNGDKPFLLARQHAEQCKELIDER